MTGATDLGAATSHNIGLSSFPGNTSLIETLDSAFTVLAEVDCIYLRKKKDEVQRRSARNWAIFSCPSPGHMAELLSVNY